MPQAQVQESHEPQELPWVPLTIPELLVFRKLRSATAVGQSQIPVQGDWDDPDVFMEQEEESSTKGAYFCIQVQTVNL